MIALISQILFWLSSAISVMFLAGAVFGAALFTNAGRNFRIEYEPLKFGCACFVVAVVFAVLASILHSLT